MMMTLANIFRNLFIIKYIFFLVLIKYLYCVELHT